MPLIKNLNLQVGDQVIVYADADDKTLIVHQECTTVHPFPGVVIALDQELDYWIGWLSNPPPDITSKSWTLHPDNKVIQYLPNWESFPFTALIRGGRYIHSVVGKLNTTTQPDQPCRQCKRKNTPGDTCCWWCCCPNPC